MNCPNCASTDIIRITYGQPPFFGERLQRAIDQKEIMLGGCALCGDAPEYGCRSCGHRFNLPGENRKKAGIMEKILDSLLKK